MGRETEVQETANKDFNFCQAIFAPPVKVAPMAGAMPIGGRTGGTAWA